MFDIKKRKVIYCLPFVFSERKIAVGNITINPIKYIFEDDKFNDLLQDFPFNKNCSVIETDTFKSGDLFDPQTYFEINKSLEILKFSYFFESPSEIMGVNGFVGNESFDFYPILERKSQLANIGFEHKIPFSNGMSDRLLSLDTYFKFRSNFLINFSLNITNEKFTYYPFFYSVSEKFDDIDLFKMYNKCWGIYSIYDFSDKALYSKISIELLSKKYFENGNKVGKTFSLFFNKVNTILSNSGSYNSDIFDVYNRYILSKIEEIIKSVDDYFHELNEERKNIAHEGKESSRFINVTPYLILFPILILVLECSEELKDRDIYRLIFLLGLFMHRVDSWQKPDFEGPIPGKRTHLNSYLNFSRLYPKYVENKSDAAGHMLKVFEKWLKESDN
ncbi:hypothetical protein [Pectobacterium aroidearum]|uniref:hypothetical protein n=1 Tax=Pectobacterium aroidearum TaxID=1201031 RepID=UPI002113B526|nr:hypothetical protein [Pectobacterium aroidearum]UUE46361.1 hypothetical protein L0Y28_06930 [Pectobacterium aroidearum]UUE50582.1 hypothetical protein L0Y23_06940 [Pectobacterium aroidearum]UUE54787.1 hypothetical protein L0Y30_06940 [Pectobacterium aroidearum]UUE63195.1 hypothetical protein L0Y29_06930 [Pectobacterium aroidearum]UUE67420.1 hypothetical protein L0Y22_06930 [Pectobacterium aroidearum]